MQLRDYDVQSQVVQPQHDQRQDSQLRGERNLNETQLVCKPKHQSNDKDQDELDIQTMEKKRNELLAQIDAATKK